MTKTKAQEMAEAWALQADDKISEICDPILSRMYLIEINHAEWLRENKLNVSRVGPGHEYYIGIAGLTKAAFLAGAAWLLQEAEKMAYPSEVDSNGEASGIEKYWVKLSDLKKLVEEG